MRKNGYYYLVCLLRFLEHLLSCSLDQKSYNEGFFSKIRERLVSTVYGNCSRGGRKNIKVNVKEVDNVEDFIINVDRRNGPVVFRGGVRGWPCSQRWSIEYFKKKCGDVSVFNIDDRITDPHAVKGSNDLASIIDDFGSGKKLYARFVPIINRFPEVLKDLDMNLLQRIIGGGKSPIKIWGDKSKGIPVRSHLFLGEARTKTSIHCELTNNFFCNVVGVKEWVVLHPMSLFALKSPVTKNPGVFGSQFDSTLAGGDLFANLDSTQLVRITLNPGDLLFLPAFYWHEVTNITDNISIGIRWYSFFDAMRSSKTLNFLSLLSTRPTMLKAIKNATEYGVVHGE
ncbi:MAG: hypothetical protein ACI86C_001697 [Candidatus Latescibacterota bacterium]|jgi:hypothetical protein